MDPTTLAVLGSLFLGLVVGNAAIFGNALHVNIDIPDRLVSTGLNKVTAEDMFVAEIHRFTQFGAILKTPSIETSTTPGFAAAIARPLNLEGIVYAIQANMHDYGVVRIVGSVVAADKSPGLTMFMVVTNPPDPPVAMALTQPDGNPKELVIKAARQAMVAIAPYRVAVTDFGDGLDGDITGFARARNAVAAGLAQPWDPREEGASETALLFNLSGLLSVYDNNVTAAAAQFAECMLVPGANQAAYAIATFNQAFLAIAARQPAEAAARYREGLQRLGTPRTPAIAARVKLLAALVAWSSGDLRGAEADLNAAIAIVDDEAMPHFYLADLLTQRGDVAGAITERDAGIRARRFGRAYPSFAHTLFFVDPAHGGYRPSF